MRYLVMFGFLALAACMTTDEEAPSPDEEMALALAKETAKPERRGFFGARLAGSADDTGASDPIQPLSELAGTLQETGGQTALVAGPENTSSPDGIFGFLRSGRASDDPGNAEVELASLSNKPEADTSGKKSAKPPRFGTVQKTCGVRRGSLGKQVATWPEKGAKIFRLYDSNPESIAVRDFYLAGFRDGCIRHLRASIVFFGAPSTHETVRYDPMNRDIAQSPTDQAYEEIKRRICGVPRGKPCGPQRIARLEATTVFVTAYDDFGSSTRWAEFLLNKGKLAGVSLKSR